MPFLFLFLSFLSGLCGLSYEVIYQRLFLTIAGDLFGIYVLVVSTFILGMALGNLAGFHLRRFLPLVEILSGLFAIGVALYLRFEGYAANLSLPALAALLSFPAFAVGTAIPLYAYYGRLVRFNGIYAVYHLGAVAAILTIEICFFPVFRQSTLLMGIGALHVAIGSLVYLLYRRGVFHIAQVQTGGSFAFYRAHKKILTYLFVFSVFSAFYHFWGLKAVFYTLMPLRLVSSFAIAASLFWVFVGALVPRLFRKAHGLRFYAAFFFAHILLILVLAGERSFFLSAPFIFGNKAGMFGVCLYFLAPCLWASAYLVSLVVQLTQTQKERTDQISGLTLFIASLGSVFGFMLALAMGFAIDKVLYFIPLYLFFLLPLALLSARRVFSRAGTAYILLFLTATAGFAWPKHVYKELLVTGNEIRQALEVSKMPLPPETVRERLLARWVLLSNNRNGGAAYKTEEAIIYPSAQATVTILPFENNPPPMPFILPEQDPIMPGRDATYMIEGYSSHLMSTGAEYAVGFLPRLYFSRPVARSLVVGVGSGETSSGVSMISDHTDLVEISGSVLGILDDLSDYNDGVKDKPNVTVIQDDAMAYLKRTDQKYQAIVNTSSAQYTVWAAKLYSDEFLQLIKNHLAPDGVYETWVDATSLTRRDLFLSYLNYLKKNFAFVDVHRIRSAYVCLVAYDQFRPVTPFSYDLLSPRALAYFNDHPNMKPSAKSLNGSFARNLAAAPGAPSLDPTLDRPTVEIEAVRTLLEESEIPSVPFPFTNGAGPESTYIYDSILRAIRDPENRSGLKPTIL